MLILTVCIIFLTIALLNTKKKLIIDNDMRERYFSYYKITNQWLKNRNKKNNVSEYFKHNNIGTIAIYGTGEMGMRLYEELKETDIRISFFVDKNCKKNQYIEKKPVISLDEIEEYDDVDAIVITPIYNFELIEENFVYKNINSIIISLQEVIEGIS